MAVGGAAPAHGGEVVGVGAVRATAVPGSPGLARNEEEDSTNSRDRGQRGENNGGKAPGRSGQLR
jgi:hypothetical protein